VRFPLLNAGEHHFSFSFGEGADEAADGDFGGAECARAAMILEVAALLIWQLRS
jgi:hypothetical protein